MFICFLFLFVSVSFLVIVTTLFFKKKEHLSHVYLTTRRGVVQAQAAIPPCKELPVPV
jgi:hypothetical protein